MVERAENWRGGWWWIVIAAVMGWSYGDGLPWWCWEWGMMKKRNLRKGFGDRKRGAKRNEGEIEHLKRRTRPLKRKCKFRTTPCVVRKFRIHVEYLDREHGFENLSQKRIRTRFAQGSHSCKIRTRDFGKGKDREHAFFENWHKSIFAQGMCRAKMAECWFFLPCFPLFSAWLHSSSLPTWMLTQKTNSKHIRTTLKSKIKIKTWKNTRKTLD